VNLSGTMNIKASRVAQAREGLVENLPAKTILLEFINRKLVSQSRLTSNRT
jgi:hypothetical protein